MSIKRIKLSIELIPKTCHYSNARTMLKPKDWDKVRFITYELAKNKCEICKSTGKKQGFKHDVECHEIWEYDDINHIQKLKGLISLCPKCHLVKHIGRAIAMRKEKIAYDHLMQVNKWNQEEMTKHILESFEIQKERSKYEWSLDLSILTQEPYLIKLDTKRKRIFEVKKYKRKKRKKSTIKKRPKK